MAASDSGGPITISKVSFDTEGGELSSASPYGEGLADSSSSTVDGGSGVLGGNTGTQTAVLLATKSRRLAKYLPGPQRSIVVKGPR